MSSSRGEPKHDTISCARHGDELPAAFLCRHLLEGRGTGWHDAESDELCPDAWCDACEQLRLANDGWEGADVEIRLLCACCYHQVRGRQLGVATSWEPMVREAVATLQARNDSLDEQHALFRQGRWSYTSDPMVLALSEDDEVFARCRALPVGSYSEVGGEFLWSWANRSYTALDRAPAAFVAGAGEAAGVSELTEACVACELSDAWERAAVAAHLLDAVGLYRCRFDGLHLFLALLDVEPAGMSGG